LLEEIAKEIYEQEIFNLGFDPKTNRKIRPLFESFKQ
jgi:hypothetical protein